VRIKSTEDFWSGLMFIAFGVVAIVVSRDYPMGSAMRMGPGYFPTYLGAIMATLGAIISARAFWLQGEGIGAWAFRPLIVLSIAFLLFGYAMDEIGFIPSLAILIVGSALAGREFKLTEVVIMTVVLVAGCWALFVKVLELPFRLFWWS
jgi:hypothetical protein